MLQLDGTRGRLGHQDAPLGYILREEFFNKEHMDK